MSNQALDKLEQRLDEAIAAANRARTTTIIVYVVLILLVGGYLTVARGFVQQMTDPKELTPIITAKIIDTLPTARREIANRIRKEAPVIVDEVASRIIRELPEGRRAINEIVARMADEQIAAIERDLDALVMEALQNHGAELGAIAKDLMEEEGRIAFENHIYEVLTEPLNDPTINPNVQGYALVLRQIADRTERLATATDLTEVERAEREFLLAIREISDRTPRYRPELDAQDAAILGK